MYSCHYILLHYGNCGTLRNLLLHLETQLLDKSQNYYYIHRTNRGTTPQSHCVLYIDFYCMVTQIRSIYRAQ